MLVGSLGRWEEIEVGWVNGGVGAGVDAIFFRYAVRKGFQNAGNAVFMVEFGEMG